MRSPALAPGGASVQSCGCPPILRRSFSMLVIAAVLAAPFARGEPRAAAVTTPIQHIVVIDLENHAFDDVLGAFCVEQKKGQIVRDGLNHGCDGTRRGVLASGQGI